MTAELSQTQYTLEITKAGDLQALEEVRLKYMGRKGLITQALAGLRDCDPSERAQIAQSLNLHKKQVLSATSFT